MSYPNSLQWAHRTARAPATAAPRVLSRMLPSRAARRAMPCKAALGFSFIEVMVVVVIIGLLAGAVAIKVGDYIDRAKINRARSDIATMVTAIESYYGINDNYPTNEEGLDALNVTTTIDPWGRAYQYNYPGPDKQPYEVVSYGRDGRQGGDGVDGDIISWNLDQQHADP